MSQRAVAVLAVVAAIAGTSIPEGQTSTGSSQTELRSLAGEWQEVSRVRDGQIVPVAQLGTLVHTEAGDVEQRLGEKVVYGGKASIDATRTPKAIDYVQTSAAFPGGLPGDVRRGIYEIAGGRLQVCLARAGAERPKTFDAAAGTDLVLSTYERMKQ